MRKILTDSFLAVRKQTPSVADIAFSIVKLIDKTNKDNIYFEVNDELSEFNNGCTERPVQRISESNVSREKSTDRKWQEHEQCTNEGYGRITKKPQFLSG